MITRATFQNFKMFQDLKVDGLKRVNLIGGQNNTGKTSLLEGIFTNYYRHNNQATAWLLKRRGIVPLHTWAPIFYRHDTQQSVDVSFQNTEKKEFGYILQITAHATIDDIQKSHLGAAILSSAPDAMSVLRFVYWEGKRSPDDDYKEYTLDGLMAAQARKVISKMHVVAERAVFVANVQGYPDLSEDWSQLKQPQKQKIIQYIRMMDPRIQGIEIGVANQTSYLQAILEDIDEPRPLAYMGDGIQSLVTLGIRLASECKYILIDEIERGFHHTFLTELWSMIFYFVTETQDLQLFITTHSQECMQAASQALQARKDLFETDLFAYVRLTRDKEKIVASTYEPDAFEAALEMNLEVR